MINSRVVREEILVDCHCGDKRSVIIKGILDGVYRWIGAEVHPVGKFLG
jgi:hypothetical protein